MIICKIIIFLTLTTLTLSSAFERTYCFCAGSTWRGWFRIMVYHNATTHRTHSWVDTCVGTKSSDENRMDIPRPPCFDEYSLRQPSCLRDNRAALPDAPDVCYIPQRKFHLHQHVSMDGREFELARHPKSIHYIYDCTGSCRMYLKDELETDVPEATLATSICNETDTEWEPLKVILPKLERERCRTERWYFLRRSGTAHLHGGMPYDED